MMSFPQAKFIAVPTPDFLLDIDLCYISFVKMLQYRSLAEVDAIVFEPLRLPLLLLLSPGGGPRAGLFGIGALHNSD